MDERSPEHAVGEHVATIAGRSEPDTERLASMLRAWCCPADATDRRVPAAVEWLRRWGPARGTAEPLDCSCASGRCAFCN
ncbi:MAG: hypothetical protein QOK19_627 [Solirubrobacteraceae bacterium]|nr:hypothetical protein [Solirubrobacteraceae bacterium]